MYNIDYNQKVVETLVPDKRAPKNIAFLQQYAKEVSDNHNWIFTNYKQTQYLSDWTSGTYAKNTVVRYSKAVYVSVINGNTSEPSYSNDWLLISPNFLGTDFRLAIRGEKIIFQYALNIWFDTTFRQPSEGTPSDIYLTTNEINEKPFIVGISEFESSSVFTTSSSEFITNTYTFDEEYNLTINIPTSFFVSLGTTDEIRESIIRNFADKYVSAGITYNIATY
jgi:hypothetical protein